ncbi:uncharacterized protein LOC141834445 [Curcuma longa]|uniref:uncharacterized protein LOC141834445 n=1 Tax=Curcuma longa TaxID=136217 RepID=UPI003D9E62E0
MPSLSLADRVCEGKRASAFGVLSGISLAGFVSGTLVARFLPTSYTFQVSASVAGFAALYMKIFLAETDGGASLADEESTLPLCSGEDESSLPKLPALRNIPASSDMITFLRSSITLTRAATVAFFTNLANSGYQAVLLYYLKAKFQFNKDQFADLMLIVGSLGATSQLLLMPLLAPVIGEERLLIIGLLASCTHVPYFAAAFAALSVLVDPSGMAQGCVTGVASFASISAPFVFTLYRTLHSEFVSCTGEDYH